RPRNDSLLYRLFEADISIAGALGSKVANRGEAGEQRVAEVVRSAGDPERQRFAGDLIVPDGFAVGMEEDVRVGFDQPGNQGCSGKLDNSSLPWGLHFGYRADCFDAVAVDQNGPTRMDLGRFTVEDAVRFEEVAGGLRRSWRLGRSGYRDH